jgi:hypothetical protein
MMKKIVLIFTVFFLFVSTLFSREGMWVPLFLEKYNLEEMQRMGFRLSAQDIYDINEASMKDAVVLFGGGCTGELISGDGLLITNHHCGYRQIQQHSSVENDYLTHGFWAKNRGEEFPNPGLSVSFLERMEDVTNAVFEGTAGFDSQDEKDKRINQNLAAIEREAQENGKYRATVRPFFYGNQYFLHVYKVYTDVRLVGAPPSAIGKFGGDTDNWMWPRHTGDFALFRIYAGKDNEPASYSPDNVPFKPKKFFPISLQGVEPDDFTMVFGFPGRTTQYLPSYAVELIRNQRNPDRIAIRDLKLDIMGTHMSGDAKVRIQYASKYAGVSNAWKKWQGENLGLDRLGAVERKKEFESEFQIWASKNGRWKSEFAPLFDLFRTQYTDYAPLAKASDYYAEILSSGIEIFTVANYFNTLLRQIDRQDEISESAALSMKRLLDNFFKDYHQPLDEEMFATLLPVLFNDLPAEYLPVELGTVLRKFQGEKLIRNLYRKSVLNDHEKLNALVASNSIQRIKAIEKDPVFALFKALRNYYDTQIYPPVQIVESSLESAMKPYMAGIMQMKKGQSFYPDANSTLRVSYGRVEGYEPRDGVKYKHYTTLEGIMEKDNPEIYDYDVPARLKELYENSDYGQYGLNGKMPVCFVASNHTTGGNSGSPVLNADGHLIGINFDRCWEGTMSDIMYDPDQCRNIALDMRYALFIIDKFAGAGYLLEEMELIR